MPYPVYTAKRFEYPTSSVGRGNYIADQLTTFFVLNPGITFVSDAVNFREGRSRTDSFYYTFVFRGGGTPGRMWAMEFAAQGNDTAETLASAFFAANPQYTAIRTTLLSRPDAQPRRRRLLVIFATTQNAQPPCTLITPAGAPDAPVAVAAYGSMYDPLDLSRPALPTLNLGNAAWPAGGTNLLIRAIDASPDECAWGGIAPCCYAGPGITPPAPPTGTSICDNCIDGSFITISTTTTTTTTGIITTTTSTSTTSTTSTTTTTTTSTSTTTTTTTTTTSTTTTTCAACTDEWIYTLPGDAPVFGSGLPVSQGTGFTHDEAPGPDVAVGFTFGQAVEPTCCYQVQASFSNSITMTGDIQSFISNNLDIGWSGGGQVYLGAGCITPSSAAGECTDSNSSSQDIILACSVDYSYCGDSQLDVTFFTTSLVGGTGNVHYDLDWSVSITATECGC